jgi:ankyrin repeat protein
VSPVQKLIDAVKAGDIEAVKRMLRDNPQLANARTEAGDSPILQAVYHAHTQLAELLLKKAPELNIFEASAVGDAKRIRELLEADAIQVNSYAHDGWTPLHLASFFGRQEAALVLLENGADLHALSKNETCNTPLHAAVAKGNADLVKLLLAAGADANAKTGNGWTPLHHAAFTGNQEITRILLAQRPDANAKNDKGQTALMIAVEKGHPEIADLLRQQKSFRETS